MARPRRGEGVDPDAMVEVAAEVFATRGYAGATLDEVGRRLGVTRQTVLHHFSTKQLLFQAVIDGEKAWAQGVASTLPTPDTKRAPFAPLRHFLGLTDEARPHVRLQHVLQGEAIAGNPVAQEFVSLRNAGIRHEVERQVRAVSDAGALAPGWTVEAATTALIGLVNGLQTQALVDRVEVVDAFDAFIASITTEGER